VLSVSTDYVAICSRINASGDVLAPSVQIEENVTLLDNIEMTCGGSTYCVACCRARTRFVDDGLK
jgi:hypothetical protein